MAMLLSCFSRFSFVPRRALRTSAWLATLAVLMFAGQAWGQSMNTDLAGDNESVPTDAAEAFTNVQNRLESALTMFPNANHISLDQEGNGFLDPSDAEIVDWVLVQARVVTEGSDPPVGEFLSYCETDGACVTQAGLLMKDGWVASVDDEGALETMVINEEREEVFIFGDLEYRPGEHDLYIAIYHRNHLAVMSSQEAASGTAQDDVYVYDLSLPGNVLNGNDNVTVSGPPPGGAPLLPPGRVAMTGGSVRSGTAVVLDDFNDVTDNLDDETLYSITDIDRDYATDLDDFNLVVNRLDAESAITFLRDLP